MDEDDFISNEEKLYRSVRSQLENEEYRYDDEGQLRITSQAFLDRNKEPSVDRAKLRNYAPILSKQSPTDGIVSLVSGDVRSIGDVETKRENGIVKHSVDVIYHPIHNLPLNLAHSQITVKPEFFGNDKKQKKAFKLLRISLARLATKSSWTLKP